MNIAWIVCFLAVGTVPGPLTVDAALLTIAEQAEVPARDAGLIADLYVREGQMVRAGEPLAKLDEEAADLARSKALVELQRARMLAGNDIKLRTAQRELQYALAENERALKSEEKLPGSVSAAERDRLQLQVQRSTLEVAQGEFELAAAKLAVEVFEQELRIAEEKLRRRRIVAPISGTVVTVSRRLGEWVEPGQVVIRVLATDKLRVEFFLTSERATADLAGRQVRFTLPSVAADSASFTGNVAFVSPEVDPLNGQVRVWAEVENRDGRLRPGLAGTLVIVQ